MRKPLLPSTPVPSAASDSRGETEIVREGGDPTRVRIAHARGARRTGRPRAAPPPYVEEVGARGCRRNLQRVADSARRIASSPPRGGFASPYEFADLCEFEHRRSATARLATRASQIGKPLPILGLEQALRSLTGSPVTGDTTTSASTSSVSPTRPDSLRSASVGESDEATLAVPLRSPSALAPRDASGHTMQLRTDHRLSLAVDR